jgi:hypothetical protein
MSLQNFDMEQPKWLQKLESFGCFKNLKEESEKNDGRVSG